MFSFLGFWFCLLDHGLFYYDLVLFGCALRACLRATVQLFSWNCISMVFYFILFSWVLVFLLFGGFMRTVCCGKWKWFGRENVFLPFFRACLCNERISCSADICFLGRVESSIPNLLIGNRIPLCWGNHWKNLIVWDLWHVSQVFNTYVQSPQAHNLVHLKVSAPWFC